MHCRRNILRRWCGGLLAFTVLCTVSAGQKPKSAQRKPVAPVSSEELRTIGLDFVQALSHFYLATHVDSFPDNEVGLMKMMLDDNRHLDEGIDTVSKYQKHRDEKIRLAAQGTVLGAQIIQEANQHLLKVMRNVSKYTREESAYQVALHNSRTKEGFTTIVRSAPWITGAMFTPRKATDDHAAIPYLISKADRSEIIVEIDRHFKEELELERSGERKRQDNHNAIVIAIDAIRKNLIGETYEDIRETK
jgi:hypothetical protein